MTDSRQSLDELLGDPMIGLLMTRDRVRPEDIRALFDRARDRALQARVPPPHVIAYESRARCLRT